jgi:hypothetical protein
MRRVYTKSPGYARLPLTRNGRRKRWDIRPLADPLMEEGAIYTPQNNSTPGSYLRFCLNKTHPFSLELEFIDRMTDYTDTGSNGKERSPPAFLQVPNAAADKWWKDPGMMDKTRCE